MKINKEQARQILDKLYSPHAQYLNLPRIELINELKEIFPEQTTEKTFLVHKGKHYHFALLQPNDSFYYACIIYSPYCDIIVSLEGTVDRNAPPKNIKLKFCSLQTYGITITNVKQTTLHKKINPKINPN